MKFRITDEETIIEKIHNEFNNTSLELLNEARSYVNKGEVKTNSINPEAIEKAKILKELGFKKSPFVKKLEAEILSNKAQTTPKEREFHFAIEHNKKYPFHKFLTERELDRICEKYGLIYASVEYYIKSIPTKNLIEIKEAPELKAEDVVDDLKIYEFRKSNFHKSEHRLYKKMIKILDGKTSFTSEELSEIVLSKNLSYCLEGRRYDSKEWSENLLSSNRVYSTLFLFQMSNGVLTGDTIIHTKPRKGLFIAAPKEHYDLSEFKKKKEGKRFYNRTSVVEKDPIVFRYVQGGVQILSKWGKEGNDPALQVGILN